jgi:hypothetical protein
VRKKRKSFNQHRARDLHPQIKGVRAAGVVNIYVQINRNLLRSQAKQYKLV